MCKCEWFFSTLLFKTMGKREFWIMPGIRWSSWAKREIISTLKGYHCTSLQVPEESVCFLQLELSCPRSSSRKHPTLETWGAAKCRSSALPGHGKSCLPLGGKWVSKLASFLRHFSNISIPILLIFNDIHVRNIVFLTFYKVCCKNIFVLRISPIWRYVSSVEEEIGLVLLVT